MLNLPTAGATPALPMNVKLLAIHADEVLLQSSDQTPALASTTFRLYCPSRRSDTSFPPAHTLSFNRIALGLGQLNYARQGRTLSEDLNSLIVKGSRTHLCPKDDLETNHGGFSQRPTRVSVVLKP
jgi:hypothetical protein